MEDTVLTCSENKDVKAQNEEGWNDDVPATKAIDVSEDAIYQAVIEDILSNHTVS